MQRVAVELEMDADQAKALDDIKAQVNAISTFPANTERPIVSQVTMRSLVAQIAVHGDTDERSLKNITESIRRICSTCQKSVLSRHFTCVRMRSPSRYLKPHYAGIN